MADLYQYYKTSTSPPWMMSQHSAVWDKVAHLGAPRSWNSKAMIYDVADPAEEVVLIQDGLMKILATSWNGDLKTLGILGPGSFLGEAAFFKDTPYRHSIHCITPCRGLAFSRDVLLGQVIPAHPDLCLYLFNNLAGKSYMMSTQVECVRFMSSEQYTAHFLYHLGVEQENKSWIYERMSAFSLSMLGELLGLHRVTVTKIINGLKKQGIISLKGENIVVLDQEALLRIIHSNL